MNFKIHPHKLLFKHPFKLAHTTRNHTLGAYLEIVNGNTKGQGEIVFPPYYPETLNSFKDYMRNISLPTSLNKKNLPEYLNHLGQNDAENKFSLAALDIALHNLLVNSEEKVTVPEIYHISGESKPSSFTLGISSTEEMKLKLEDAKNFEYIKLKVDEQNMERIITAFQKLSNKAFVVDANQGFISKESALEWCIELHKLGVDYLEQPFHKDDLKSHQWLSERSPIPIIADESFQTQGDIEKLKHVFSGVNIKLMKCGGILPAYNCFQDAKKQKLLTILGCMSESSVAVEAASHLSPMADWVDLDGPFLLKGIQAM